MFTPQLRRIVAHDRAALKELIVGVEAREDGSFWLLVGEGPPGTDDLVLIPPPEKDVGEGGGREPDGGPRPAHHPRPRPVGDDLTDLIELGVESLDGGLDPEIVPADEQQPAAGFEPRPDLGAPLSGGRASLLKVDHGLGPRALDRVVEPAAGVDGPLPGAQPLPTVRNDRRTSDRGRGLVAKDLEGRDRLEDTGVGEQVGGAGGTAAGHDWTVADRRDGVMSS